MPRSIVLGTVSLLTLGTAAPVPAQEPPALEAPAAASADDPPIPPPAEPPSAREDDPPKPPVVSRPLLVIPGVTAPASSRTARKPAADAVRAPDAPSTPPALDGPAAPTIPLRLESLDDEAGPEAKKPAEAGDARKPTGDPPASSPRRPGVGFGRLRGEPGDGLSVESEGDPAVEAAVKRRVEKQVQAALGDRVKDVQVRVAGRSISVRARASRFWHRWGVRRALDALPAPAGYRVHAQLVD